MASFQPTRGLCVTCLVRHIPTVEPPSSLATDEALTQLIWFEYGFGVVRQRAVLQTRSETPDARHQVVRPEHPSTHGFGQR